MAGQARLLRTVFVYSTGLLDAFNAHGLRASLDQLVKLHDGWLVGQEDADAAAAGVAETDAAATEAVRDAFGVEAVTEALERESALLAHLNLHADYHRAELWKALIPATQLALLEPLLPEGVSPHAVGSFGDKLAFPVRLDAIPDAEQLIGWAYLANNYRILSYRPQADPSKCKERLARQIVDQWFGEEFDAKQQEWFRRFVSTARNVGLGIPTDLSSDVRTEIGSG